MQRWGQTRCTCDLTHFAFHGEESINHHSWLVGCKALGELTPSLSRAELDRYERLRIQFEGQGTRSASSSA